MAKSVTKRLCNKGVFLQADQDKHHYVFLHCDRPPFHRGPCRQLKVRGGLEGDIPSESKRTFLVRWNEVSK